ncbi:uncharacterized protein LOC129277568 [Lytechinus pictus]|uniref:uncharacterized protein LOC129277568 n=1 Tax=Lytechinus pictus TaxID=7653 RepID=UPI0030BA1602
MTFFVDKPIVRSDPPHLTKTSFQLIPNYDNDVKEPPCQENTCLTTNETKEQTDLKEEEEEAEKGGKSKSEGEDEEGEEEKKESFKEDTVEDPLKGLSPEEINQLAIRAFWTSTTRRMTEQACLPVPKFRPPSSTLERNADLVKYRPWRYDVGPATWQEITPPVWDRIQERARIKPRQSYPRPTPVINTTAFTPIPAINRPKSGKSKLKDGGSISVNEKITDLVKRERLTSTYVRQCPGYAGYRPRSPLRIPMENLNEPNLRMMTTMKASYRPLMFPLINMDHFLHKGPMSRTVTLTYPYNPFSKVEKLRSYGRNDV